MMRRLFFLLVCFMLLPLLVSAQERSVRTERVGFLDDLSKILVDGDRKKGTKLSEEFRMAWDSLIFYDGQRDTIIYTINVLLARKAQAFPDLEAYLNAIMAIHKTMHPVESYQVWTRYLIKQLQKKAPMTTIVDILNNTTLMFQRNIVYTLREIEWRSSSDNFRFYEGKELYAEYPNTTLMCHFRSDSVMLLNTAGKYYPRKGEWQGKGGRVTWQRAGKDSTSLYVEVGNYHIDMSKMEYTSDTSWLTHTDLEFNGIPGRFADKLIPGTTESNARYPYFETFNDDFEVPALFQRFRYTGGIVVQGARTIGTMFNKKMAQVEFIGAQNTKVEVKSKRFILEKRQISAIQASPSIFLDTFVIEHVGLNFRMKEDSLKGWQMALYRDYQGVSQSMYYDEYHQLEIDAGLVIWNIDSSYMDFSPNQVDASGSIYLRSADYFDEEEILVGGLYPMHPVLIVYKFGSEEVYAHKLARSLGLPTEQATNLLIGLSYQGMVIWDSEEKMGTLTRRFYRFADALRAKKDFDVIEVFSRKNKLVRNDSMYVDKSDSLQFGLPNARLDLTTKRLDIYHVNAIPVSQRQNMVLRPIDRHVSFDRSRDISFDGNVQVGAFTYYGRNFTFFYDDFKINLNNVDSLSLIVTQTLYDINGNKKSEEKRLVNVIENIKGDLLIDDPDNKSGIKDFPEYPIFNSYDTSYVYYDRTVKPYGVYPRDKFYFKIYPYMIDSLSRFSINKWALLGQFHSDSIFPVFYDLNLIIQPDYSLGFIKESSPEGDTLYGGKALFFNTLILDTRGLVAAGKMRYLTAEMHSQQFNFFPDSMNCLANSFTLAPVKKDNFFPTTAFEPGKYPEYPIVAADTLFMQFYPFADTLLANFTQRKKMKSPFRIYGEEALFGGATTLTPQDYTGNGGVRINQGRIISSLFKFNSRYFIADTSDFFLEPEVFTEFNNTEDSLMFDTKQVSTNVNFDERVGRFKSLSPETYVTFPHNLYVCNMDEFIWFMDKSEITLSSSNSYEYTVDDLPLQATGAMFRSVHPKQDSLSFFAAKSNFDIKQKTIHAAGVIYIEVADAKIFVTDGKVDIERRAKMRTLDNAKIKILKHEIFNSTVTIEGRTSYFGSGYYNYVDENDSTLIINMESITVSDSTQTTVGKGRVGIEQNFLLSPAFGFYGVVNLNANREELEFDGQFRLQHQCDKLSVNPIDRPWVEFKTLINPDSVVIPLSKLNQTNNIYAASVITIDSTHMYSAFGNKLKYWSDIPVFSADSLLYFQKNTNKYVITTPEKLSNFELPGNMVTLHRNFCNIYSEGDANLGVDLGQLKINQSGSLIHNIEKNSVSMELMMSNQFFFDPRCIDLMYEQINTSASAEAIDMSKPSFKKYLSELTSDKTANEVLGQLGSTGTIGNVPPELQATIVFTQLNMVWKEEQKAYWSEGKLGIGFINGKPVNKLVNGNLEIIKRKTGDIYNLYIEASPDQWFFYTYRMNQIKGIASDVVFANYIAEKKDKDREMEIKNDGPPFRYDPSSERVKNQFLSRIKGRTDTGDEEDEE